MTAATLSSQVQVKKGKEKGANRNGNYERKQALASEGAG